jgi:hypothetical protein
MGDATFPELSRRARQALDAMRNDTMSGDGEWYSLGYEPNIGRATIAELLRAGLIEPRPMPRWRKGAEHYAPQYFRLAPDDFGDLWVE